MTATEEHDNANPFSTNPDEKATGFIEAITGPMFAEKSGRLISRLNFMTVKYGKDRVAAFKPAIDTRWEGAEIRSRSGACFPAEIVNNSEEILRLTRQRGLRAIGIDEAHFFDEEIPAVINTLANEGVYVIVSLLDKDYRGEQFRFAWKILGLADHIEKKCAVCAQCGRNAYFTQRKVGKSRAQIMIGDLDEYEPRCRACFIKPL